MKKMVPLMLLFSLLSAAAAAGAVPSDDLELVAENERLREENVLLRAALGRRAAKDAQQQPPLKQNLRGTKPNIFLLFGDDIGHGDLGIFGHPTSRTPSLDKMASEGAKLTMYESAANVCSPSRSSIMVRRKPRFLSVRYPASEAAAG